ncbi:MAG: hypothetical protein LBL04_02975, partial [Bacteroidales bacterium]|nr:hypothetical protein [Bacteroidales bacterium]
MKKILVFFGLFLVMVFISCKESPKPSESTEETLPEYELTGEMLQKYNEYNFVVGTQTIGAGSQYKFTEKPVLIETAERILAMGSNILKIHLNPDTETPANFRQASPLVLASQESTFKALLEMNFTYYLLWVMDTPGVEWRNGMSAKELELEYQSVRELVEYFRDRFRGTGKKFYIGHWEGDWLLLSNLGDAQERVDPTRIQGMIDWYNIRQKAVDDA